MQSGLLVQVLVAGLAAGAAYGLIGLGYSLVLRMSGVLDFGHGDLAVVGVFAFLLLLGGGSQVATGAAHPGALLGAAALAVGAAAAAALLVLGLGAGPSLRAGSVGGWVAGSAAAGLLLSSAIGLTLPAQGYSVPDLLAAGHPAGWGGLAVLGGGMIQARDLGVLAAGLALAIGFDRALALTRTGRAMRATADAPEAARLVGVSPERMRVLAWLLAGALAAIAGLLVAPARPVTLELGAILGLKGVAAAVLGGMGSARGAMAAGLALGVLESVLTNLALPAVAGGPPLGPFPQFHDLAAPVLLLAALCLAPRLLGAREPEVD